MEIAVRTRDIVWNEQLQQHLRRSIEFAVDRYQNRITRIAVQLADLNGPRGGADKLCRITAELRGVRPIQILDTGDDLVAVMNRAIRRLGYRVGRRIERRRVAGAAEYRATIREA